MPKVAKVKFDNKGNALPLTTFTGYKFLDLFYEGKDDYFYFKYEDVVKLAPSIRRIDLSFNRCKTRGQAQDLMSVLFGGAINTEPYIAVSIKGTGSKGVSMDGINISTYENNTKSSLEIKLHLCLRTESPTSSSIYYYACGPDFKLFTKDSRLDSYHHTQYTFIKWTAKREESLTRLKGNLDKLAVNLAVYLQGALQEGVMEELLDGEDVSLKLKA